MSAIKHFRQYATKKAAFIPTDSSEYFEGTQDLLPYLTELQEGFVKSGYTVGYAFGLASAADGGNLLLSGSGRASFYITATKGAEMLEVRLTLTESLTKKVIGALGDQNFRADYADNAGQAAVRAALPVIGNRRFGKHTETGALFMF